MFVCLYRIVKNDGPGNFCKESDTDVWFAVTCSWTHKVFWTPFCAYFSRKKVPNPTDDSFFTPNYLHRRGSLPYECSSTQTQMPHMGTDSMEFSVWRDIMDSAKYTFTDMCHTCRHWTRKRWNFVLARGCFTPLHFKVGPKCHAFQIPQPVGG